MAHSRLLWIYNTILTCLWPFFFLYYRLRASTDGKYRKSFRRRLGLEPPPAMESSRRVWIHALSVGETLSVIPLVEALKNQDPSMEIVFSTSTETGHEIARRNLSPWVREFMTMPLDFPWAVKRMIAGVKPAVFVLTETDLWPNLLINLSQKEVPVVLVNGRISDRSFLRLWKLRWVMKGMFSTLDTVFAQSPADREKFEVLGVPGPQVHAVGNLKVDSALRPLSAEAVNRLRESAGIDPDRPVWIAGSTHEGEEEILLRVHGRLRHDHPELLLIIAPRNVRRAGDVASFAKERGLSAASRSRGETAEGRAVYLLDTLGELSRFYSIARFTFIGGSLVPFGGHNPLEATAQGRFAVWGPHLFNFRELEIQLMEAGCGAKVSSEADLAGIADPFIRDTGLRDEMQNKAARVISMQRGPCQRIAREIVEKLMQPWPEPDCLPLTTNDTVPRTSSGHPKQ